MHSLTNKRILLGVTGGIAAYKSAELLRKLQNAGAQVRVVMTKGAQEFITPLTMQALSGKPVHIDLLDTGAEAAMGHIELSRWADVILIAPASANFIAKLASGEGSDLLSTLCLASRSQLALAPAMNQGMWNNAATQANVAALAERGVEIFGPAAGEQACGDVGLGRMLEPEALLDSVLGLFTSGVLTGKKVVITAGPTREPIDPVRFISNHSSGKMGYAIAEAAVEAGAEVVLVSGPVTLPAPDRAKRVFVESALDMQNAVEQHCQGADIFIGAAAVADFRPISVAAQKIKKGSAESARLEMVKNPDIIASLSAKKIVPFIVGFAAETENVIAYARKKLSEKKLDMIIANDVSDSSIGFNSDNNAVEIVSENDSESLPAQSKSNIARQIVRRIALKFMDKHYQEKSPKDTV